MQRRDFAALLEQRVNTARRGVRCGKRRDARNMIADGGAANRFFVIKRFAAERRVHDQVDLAGFHQVHDVRPAFIHFEDGLRFDARRLQSGGRSPRSHDAEPELGELLANRSDVPLVAVVHADEHCAAPRKPLARSELRLGKRLPECRGNTHDFTRRAHLGSKNRVHAPKFVERENGRLHGVELMDGDLRNAVRAHQRKIHLRELASHHEPRRSLRKRHARRLTDVGHGARRAGVYLEHVNMFVLDGVLHVHQPDDLQSQGEPLRIFANRVQNERRQAHRGKNTGRVSGVYSRLFDVLHDPTNDDVGAVGQCIHIDFRSLFEELVDENRLRGAH